MQDASFVAMLKAFLTRQEGDASKFDELLADAVKLCNLDVVPGTGTETATLKRHLAEYCKDNPEAVRYSHLVDALNAILRWKFVEPRVIFVHNNPVIVGCPTNLNRAKTKPDIIFAAVSTVARWFEREAFTFDNCCEAFSDQTPFDRNNVSWSDVCQTWELKKDVLASPDALKKTYTTPKPESSPPCTTGEKRKFGDVPGGHRKRPRWDYPIPMAGYNTSELPPAPPDVQCEYYVAECFRCSWDITNTTVVYLEGSQLSLSWYDPQGEIASEAFDIIEELPLFIVFISVLGLCDGLSGVGKAAKAIEAHGKVGKTRHFDAHLTRRRTFGADFARKVAGAIVPTTSNHDHPQPDVALCFLKVSWPEEVLGYEPHIIQQALKRADTLLPLNCRDYVKDHLPRIIDHGDIDGTSTGIIRKHLGLDETGSRIQRWVISARLSPLTVTVSTPEDFYTAYWEIIRCHYLMWIMGIAHGDISFSNCMFDISTRKGILNDFNLSSIMDPGSDYPSPSSQEPTGTKPFMSLDLLTEEGYSGRLARRYRHGLESFSWTLLWVTVCVSIVNGDVVERMVSPVVDWVGVDPGVVWDKKFSFLGSSNSFWSAQSDDNPLLSATPNSLKGFLQMWRSFYFSRPDSKEANEVETNGHDLLEKMVVLAGEDFPKKIKEDWLEAGVRTAIVNKWATSRML